MPNLIPGAGNRIVNKVNHTYVDVEDNCLANKSVPPPQKNK